MVLPAKHSSVFPLTYGKFVLSLFGNWSTGTTIARGCKCPDCFILKFSYEQLLMENSLERCVHGFPLICAKDRYSVTEKGAASVLGSYHLRDWSTDQFRGHRTDGQGAAPHTGSASHRCTSIHCCQLLYRIFSLPETIWVLHGSIGSVQLYRLCRILLCLVPYSLKHSSSLT